MSETKRIKISPNGEERQLKLKSGGATNSDGEGVIANTCPKSIDILPPELWELIFKKVESSKDLVNCWNTTSTWATALRSTEFYFKMTLPFIMPYLGHDDLLKCSSVSKSWMTEIDTCMQNAEECLDLKNRLAGEQLIVFELDYRKFSYFIKRFTTSTNNESKEKITAINPVVFRRFEVEVDFRNPLSMEPEDRNDIISSYQKNLLKCLDHSGHLIRYLGLRIDDKENLSCLDKIKLIRNCLEKAPNLRVLDIFVDDSIDEENAPVAELEAFNLHISENPWPTLDYLKVLKLGRYTISNREEYASLANAYAPQLIYFEFSFILAGQLEPMRLVPTKFSCLQKIVYLVSIETIDGMEFGNFVQSTHCPLKHLVVEIIDNPNVDNFDGVTMAANAASATLETLVFRPNFEVDDDDIVKLYNYDITKIEGLRLPNLKKLELSYFSYPSLQFLQSVCPALQQLIVSPLVHDYGVLQIPGDIYIKLYTAHSFWNELADMKTVNVEIMFHSEEGLINGKMEKIPGGTERKLYTRRKYEAK